MTTLLTGGTVVTLGGHCATVRRQSSSRSIAEHVFSLAVPPMRVGAGPGPISDDSDGLLATLVASRLRPGRRRHHGPSRRASHTSRRASHTSLALGRMLARSRTGRLCTRQGPPRPTLRRRLRYPAARPRRRAQPQPFQGSSCGSPHLRFASCERSPTPVKPSPRDRRPQCGRGTCASDGVLPIAKRIAKTSKAPATGEFSPLPVRIRRRAQMQILPVTYPQGPVALTHALTNPGPPQYPGPPFQGPPQCPSPSPCQGPCPCPCPSSCGNGAAGVAGSGVALATPPAPSPTALKPKAATTAAAEIVLFRFTVHSPCRYPLQGPSLEPGFYLAPIRSEIEEVVRVHGSAIQSVSVSASCPSRAGDTTFKFKAAAVAGPTMPSTFKPRVLR